MKTELKIEKPKDNRPLFFADGVRLISDAAKISIVCEDFVSHRFQDADLSGEFYSQTNLAYALGTLPHGEQWREDMPMPFSWRVDAQNRLIVGSAAKWPWHHDHLVPESLLVNLRNKINGKGADLDDVLPVACLTPGQREDWVTSSRDLHVAHCEVWPDLAPLWRFYDSLSSRDKALAKSEAGLKLSSFDPGKLAALFSETTTAMARIAGQEPKMSPAFLFAFRLVREDYELAQRVQAWAKSRPKLPETDEAGYMERQEQTLAEMAAEFPELAVPVIPTDIDAILGLTLRITRRKTPPFVRVYKECDYQEGKAWQIETGPAGIDRHSYDMTLEGSGKSLRIPGPHIAFPVFSAEREKKLWEQKKKSAKQDPAKATK